MNTTPETKCGRQHRCKNRFGIRRRISKRYRQDHLPITLCVFLVSFLILAYIFQSSENPSRRQLEDCEEVVVVPESDEKTLFEIDFFTLSQNRNGAVIVHILVMMYMFAGLAAICDNYFEPALGALCEDLQLSDDVAGATFMAAGGSAPELATSVLGVFVAQSDIGFGTIVGSAVFNVLFVIAICAVVAPGLELTWWPLTRDCIFYCFSILALVMCVLDQVVQWYEAIILFCIYLLYILIMKFNEQLFMYIDAELQKPSPHSCIRTSIRNAVDHWVFRGTILMLITANFLFIILESVKPSEIWTTLNMICSLLFILEYVLKSLAYGWFSFWKDSWNAVDGGLVFMIVVEWLVDSTMRAGSIRAIRLFRFIRVIRSVRIVRLMEAGHSISSTRTTQTYEKDFVSPFTGWDFKKPIDFNMLKITYYAPRKSTKMSGILPCDDQTDDETINLIPETSKCRADSVTPANSDDETESDGPDDLFDIPDSMYGKFFWALLFPLNAVFYATIVDTTSPEKAKYWGRSFFACVTWIGILSYIMVWMATILGLTFGIPDPVMGLTLLAGGTSIPDLLSSAAVAKKGLGDMAVSSSIGSNIFDILVGLPVPWILYTCAIHIGESIAIKSPNISIMVMSLFLMVAFVCLSVHFYGWTLNINLAYTFTFLYVLFVIESLLLEYGVIFSNC